MSSRPIISWFVAMGLPPDGFGWDAGHGAPGRRNRGRARARRAASVMATGPAVGPEVGEEDPGAPLRPRASASEAGRKRANVGASAAPVDGEEAVAAVEGDAREDQLGLVGEHELEGVVLEQLVRGGGGHRDERVVERDMPVDDGRRRSRRGCAPPRGRRRAGAAAACRRSSGRRWPGRSRPPWRRPRASSSPRRSGRGRRGWRRGSARGPPQSRCSPCPGRSTSDLALRGHP